MVSLKLLHRTYSISGLFWLKYHITPMRFVLDIIKLSIYVVSKIYFRLLLPNY